MATTSTTPTETRTEKGISLARGPALVLGTILEVAGLYLLYKQHVFPKFSNFPSGAAPVQSKVFLGIFGANGWTGLFTTAAGGLLLFGAAQHLLAKTMSLLVGLALGAAAIISAVSGDVLGLAAANTWTKVGWGGCALILLFNTLIPRRKRIIEEPVAERPATSTRTERSARTVEPETRGVEPETQTVEPATRVRSVDSDEPDSRASAPPEEPLVTRDREASLDSRDGETSADAGAVVARPGVDSERQDRIEPLENRGSDAASSVTTSRTE